MPLGEIAGELLRPVFRFIASIFIELVFEVLLRGAGYLICRPFSKKVSPDDGLVLFIGMLFWIAVITLGFIAYSYVETNIAIDTCLDSGGKFDYKREECVQE